MNVIMKKNNNFFGFINFFKSILNFILSIVIGYSVTLLFGLIAISIFFALSDVYSRSNYIVFYLYEIRSSLVELSLLSLIPWAIISFLSYKLMKRRIFK